MQHLEVNGAVRLIYKSLGVKGLSDDVPNFKRLALTNATERTKRDNAMAD